VCLGIACVCAVFGWGEEGSAFLLFRLTARQNRLRKIFLSRIWLKKNGILFSSLNSPCLKVSVASLGFWKTLSGAPSAMAFVGVLNLFFLSSSSSSYNNNNNKEPAPVLVETELATGTV
jgi:hypothetical protein